MPSLNDSNASAGKAYWRSLDEIADTPQFRQFLHHEFPAGAAEMLDSAGRRDFLKIMAASMALGGLGLSGCRRWPEEHIAPFANRPPNRIPGKSQQYATCMTVGGVASGLLATSMDGRPIKMEGNPELPGRGTTAIGQAHVLGLYDPDRSRAIVHRGDGGRQRSDWDAFTRAVAPHLQQHRERQGTGLHVLSEAVSSPSVRAMKQRLEAAFPRVQWHEYEPIGNDQEILGTGMAFGSPARPQYDFSRAAVVVSLDADFLFDHGDARRHIGDFAARRRAPDVESCRARLRRELGRDPGPEALAECLRSEATRLYAFESAYSLTGANADHRAAVRSADVSLIAAWLATRVLGEQSLRRFEQDPLAGSVLDAGVTAALETALADLQAHPGQGLVIAGRRQPPAVHMLAHLMNEALGNAGTVAYTSASDTPAHARSMAALAAAMERGEVETLVILGGNPAYDAPADLDFASWLGSVALTVRLGDYEDETSEACTWHVNRAHELEAWGDGRTWDGTMCLRQPLIQPLFGGRSEIELLAFLAGETVSAGYDIVRQTFQDMTGSSDEAQWRRTLHDGHLAGSAMTRDRLRGRREAVAAEVGRLFEQWQAARAGDLELVFTTDSSVWDGRYANNGWLQELPDPMTKLTWDNAAIVGPQTAGRLRLASGDRVRLTLGGRSVEAAVFVLPGQAEGSLTLPLGYGRRLPGGRIAAGAGFDFYRLRTTQAMGFAGGGGIQKIGGRYPLATTQDHHTIDLDKFAARGVQNRLPSLVREGTVGGYAEQPEFAHHKAHVVHRLSLWDDESARPTKSGPLTHGAPYAWGMSIDLSACVGCNACVTACQAENNIPIVGKDQVSRGREMHWIRIDRYFRFGEDGQHRPDPARLRGVSMQPVPCMHCENAACEQVCPVAATSHDKDGLNVMVYNRCIGTRYCSNNCPYKVRRFNYFDYHRRDPHREQPGILAVKPTYYPKPQAGADPLEQMQMNPEVSVRVRGVMEKCTYCIQRISAAKIQAKNEWVKLPQDDPRRHGERVAIRDGAVVTACQEACPAEAIIFGDLNDPESRVARAHARDRSYQMLEELHPKPRTRYLARLWNPHPDLEEPVEAAHH